MQEASVENAAKEREADYQVYAAAGTHREIGVITAQKGSGLMYADPALSAEQRRYAERCRDIVGRIYPEMLEEFNCYAQGLGLEEDSMLWHYTLGVEGGCSGIAVRTPDEMVVARNYDFYYFESRRHLIYTRPDRGYSHIGMHEGLVGGRFDGMNEKGLYVSFNGAGQHPNPSVPGMSFHLIVRYVLEKCADAYDGSNSAARYQSVVSAGMAAREGSIDGMQALQNAFRDHEAPVCGHADGLATFWSRIAKPRTREIYYCLGAPCRNDYRLYYTFAGSDKR